MHTTQSARSERSYDGLRTPNYTLLLEEQVFLIEICKEPNPS